MRIRWSCHLKTGADSPVAAGSLGNRHCFEGGQRAPLRLAAVTREMRLAPRHLPANGHDRIQRLIGSWKMMRSRGAQLPECSSRLPEQVRNSGVRRAFGFVGGLRTALRKRICPVSCADGPSRPRIASAVALLPDPTRLPAQDLASSSCRLTPRTARWRQIEPRGRDVKKRHEAMLFIAGSEVAQDSVLT